MINGVFDLVEIPRRVRAQDRLECRYGFGPVALLIADRYADSDTGMRRPMFPVAPVTRMVMISP
jgi:hypothetical protein